MNRLFMRFSAAVGTGALLIASSGLAAADNVLSDDIAAGGNTALTLVGGTASTDIDFRIVGNGPDGCDADDGTAATLTVGITGGPSGGLTGSPASLVFTHCVEGPNKNEQPMTFTATQPGTYTVTTSVADSGSNNGYSVLTFTITVSGPSNTAPSVAVTGVDNNATYELGAVPAAGCQVTDAEDGNSTNPATLSAISGPLAAYGIGDQTATCTHTDSGGLSATPASVTYTIDDTTKPVLIGMPSGQVLEATSSAGATATWVDPTADDLSGIASGPTCSPASGSTFALGTTEVTCTVTDNGGNTQTGTFDITVQDTTDPVIVGGAGNTVEATGPLTPVSFTEPTASDTVDTSVPVVCVPPSGSSFPVGATTVTCTAIDDSTNSSSVELDVTVTDLTGPAITAPDIEDVEATGPGGAAVSFNPTASDLVDGDRSVSCDYESGDTFPLGTTTVSCSSTDSRGNTTNDSFTVEVVDTTAPELTVPADITEEATGPSGAVVNFAASATDIVDTDVMVSCIPASGSTFGLGTTTVTCTAVDDSLNEDEGSFTVTVVDTTPPTVTVPADITEEATGPSGAVVTFTASATDIVDGAVTTTCVPASGSTFPLGTTEVTCSATDAATNTGSDTFDVTVQDTTGPDLTLPANITTGATSAAGATVSYSATASDIVDGSVPVTCTPVSDSTFAPGTSTVNCSATDAAGNTSNGSFTVTVNFDWTGFFAPVDNGGVLNVIKGGQSVPMKWRISNGSGGWVSSLAVVQSTTQTKITCANTALEDPIEAPTSGATSLRYDTTANQYIYNWQSPKVAGVCYRVTVYLTDDTTHSALFKTK